MYARDEWSACIKEYFDIDLFKKMLRRFLSTQRTGLPNRITCLAATQPPRRSISILGHTITKTRRTPSLPSTTTTTTTKHHEPRKFWPETIRWTTRTFVVALGAGLVAHVFVDHFYAMTGTWGASMLPTLAASGTAVITSKYYRHGRAIKVGDLVSFRSPVDHGTTVIKRVIGMPGDFVLRDTPGQGEGIMIQVT
jgi:hypothetical protein